MPPGAPAPVWEVAEISGSAGSLHAGSVGALGEPRRVMRVLHATAGALVLGSSQPLSDFDAAALDRSGLEVVRRRSGGGAVIVGPGRVLWVDFVVPGGDPLSDPDVARAAWWVGELWRLALERAGIGEAEVWKGPMVRRRWASRVCFAGLGPGEVRLAGRKVVGVSQRRARGAALFQTAAMLDWAPQEYLELMAGRPDGAGELAAAAVGLGPEVEQRLLAEVLSAASSLPC